MKGPINRERFVKANYEVWGNAACNAAGTWDVAQSLPESRWVIRKTARGALDCRDARRRTRTAKLLNSNSFIGTNNRFGLPVKLVKNFISIFKLLFMLLPI